LGEGLDLLVHHDDVGFEEGFERDAGSRERGEEGEVEDVEEGLVSPDQGVVLDPVVPTRTPIAVCCVGTRESLSHQKEETSHSVQQHQCHEESLEHSPPEGEHPESVLEGSGGRKLTGSLLAGPFLERDLHKQDPVSGYLRERSTRPDQDAQDHQHPYAATHRHRHRQAHGIAPFASDGEDGGVFRYLTGELSHNIRQRRQGR